MTMLRALLLTFAVAYLIPRAPVRSGTPSDGGAEHTSMYVHTAAGGDTAALGEDQYEHWVVRTRMLNPLPLSVDHRVRVSAPDWLEIGRFLAGKRSRWIRWPGCFQSVWIGFALPEQTRKRETAFRGVRRCSSVAKGGQRRPRLAGKLEVYEKELITPAKRII
ncbi:hypothetical protein R3P38DRAFT_2767660 [Favolaschia claudopus]|uniref:Uncharacterized protein n=1 Tax=Favolaschia claudopus TaxID=2862362 RepID=A0AAW0CRY4_9AGAR